MLDAQFGSLGIYPIVSASTTLQQFIEEGRDISPFYRRANSYTCQLGPEAGIAWVLMTAGNLKQLDSRLPHDLTLGLGTKSITIKKMVIVQSQRLLPSEHQSSDALHLVQLADVRWLLKQRRINKRYNLRKYCTESDWIEGTLKTPGNPWTFLEIVEDIWNQFDVFNVLPQNISFFPQGASFDPTDVYGDLPTHNPENLRFEEMSAIDALHQLCQQNGFFIRFDPELAIIQLIKIGYQPDPTPGADGDFSTGFGGAGGLRGILGPVNPKYAPTGYSTPRFTSDGLEQDGEAFLGNVNVPEAVRVVFPSNGDGCADIDETNSNSGRGWFYSVRKTADTIHSTTLLGQFYDFLDTPIPDTEINVYSTTTAQFDSSTSTMPTNLTSLGEIAARIAADYYRTIGLNAHGRVVYNSIVEVIPGPIITEVTWREWGDGVKTEIAKSPIPVGLPKLPKLFSEGGGGGMSMIMFEVDSIIRGFGLDCNAVLARVINIGCNMTGISIGDTIEVWDGLRCNFNLAPDLLIGLRGYAVSMRNPGPYEEGVAPGPVADGACRWEVIRTCCAEELS